jgi:hypothetical protein
VVVMTVLIQQRIYGRSVRAIARTHGCAVTEVNAVIDRFADATIDEKTRKHSLALELARLDQLQETFYTQALEADVQSGALMAKLIERKCVMDRDACHKSAKRQIELHGHGYRLDIGLDGLPLDPNRPFNRAR